MVTLQFIRLPVTETVVADHRYSKTIVDTACTCKYFVFYMQYTRSICGWFVVDGDAM